MLEDQITEEPTTTPEPTPSVQISDPAATQIPPLSQEQTPTTETSDVAQPQIINAELVPISETTIPAQPSQLAITEPTPDPLPEPTTVVEHSEITESPLGNLGSPRNDPDSSPEASGHYGAGISTTPPTNPEPNVVVKEIIREAPIDRVVERVVEKPVEVIKEVPVDRVVEKVVEKPVEKIIEKEVVREIHVFDLGKHAAELKKRALGLVASATAKRQEKREQKFAKIMEAARARGRIGNDEVQILVAVSDRTARGYLAELVKQGKLKSVHGRGRWAHYVPTP